MVFIDFVRSHRRLFAEQECSLSKFSKKGRENGAHTRFVRTEDSKQCLSDLFYAVVNE